MTFNRFRIDSPWQQFQDIDIEFHDRLTVLTGANGSGKTTILNILAKHCGWDYNSLATPKKNKISRVWDWAVSLVVNDQSNTSQTIGYIEYSDKVKTSLVVPQQNSAQYQVQIKTQQVVESFFIPSHRSVFRYQPLTNIPTQGTIDKMQAFQKIANSNRGRYFGGQDQSSSFYMKETLVSWNIFGRGNIDMEANETLLENYEGFEGVLRIILPKELGFKKFVIRNFEVVLECDSGDFVIDAASGGISAIIDIAWQIYMYTTEKNSIFTVLIDEIENHLHPIIQRRLLPDFVSAFPNVRFVISTHSPLIVGSVKDSRVYVLRNNEDKKIVSQRLDLVKEAKTAAEILDEVLGVSFTMPIWAEEKLNEIVTRYSSTDVTKQSFKEMRSELVEAGLEKLMPKAIGDILDKENEKNK